MMATEELFGWGFTAAMALECAQKRIKNDVASDGNPLMASNADVDADSLIRQF